MLAFYSPFVSSILPIPLWFFAFISVIPSNGFIWIGAGLSPCGPFGCGPAGFAPPPPLYRPGFGGGYGGGGYGGFGYKPEGGCCCQPGCPPQSCCPSCQQCCQQTTTCCQTTTTCCQQQSSCSSCQQSNGCCQSGGCSGSPGTAILQPVGVGDPSKLPNNKELPSLIGAPLPESPNIIYVALPAPGESGDKTSDKGLEDGDEKDSEAEKKTTKRHTTTKGVESPTPTTKQTDEPPSTSDKSKTSARDAEVEVVTFEPRQSQVEVAPAALRSNPFLRLTSVQIKPSSKNYSTTMDYLYEEEISDLSTSPPPKLIVADVSARSQRLVPIDLFEKRYNLLRRLKEHSFNNIKQFSAPSLTNNDNRRRLQNTKCNNQKLARVMSKAMVSDLSISKRLIRKATEYSFTGNKFDVLCAKKNFSYSIYADQYCEASRGNTTCFAFRFL